MHHPYHHMASPSLLPLETDIICARGRTAYNHEGNRRFRGILEQHLDAYRNATTKQEKSRVVVTVLEEIQRSQYRFVRSRKDAKDDDGDGDGGHWMEVEEHVRREKVGIVPCIVCMVLCV